MSKEINFYAFSKNAELIDNASVPAISAIPDWYKAIPPFTNGDKKIHFPMSYGVPNVSIKRCVPFMDAITNGYMYVLSDDIYIEQVDEKPFIRWRNSHEVISWHTPEQFKGVPIPFGYQKDFVAKWSHDWVIKTPKGYSVLFTHPFNRYDLPFQTISGIVDCDTYEVPIQFPFFLKEGFEGMIEKGTPVCQLTLFKRENWKSQKHPYDADKTMKDNFKFFQTFVGSYKKNFWQRKEYK